MRGAVASAAAHRRQRRAPPPPPRHDSGDDGSASDVSNLDELALDFLPAPNADKQQQKPQPRRLKRARHTSPVPQPKLATTTITAAGLPGDSFVSEAPRPPAVKRSKNDRRTKPADATAVPAVNAAKLLPKRVRADAAKAA
ncbi:hypothetical protein HK405_014842, partial [Cladochytrium tenue]